MLIAAMMLLLSGTDARDSALQQAMRCIDDAVGMIRLGSQTCRDGTTYSQLVKVRRDIEELRAAKGNIDDVYDYTRGLGIGAGLIGCGLNVGTLLSETLEALDKARGVSTARREPRPSGKRVELFEDRGEMFVRAGTKEGLTVGSQVKLLGEEKRAIGSASVMEVWDSIARINPDVKARKGAPRFALVAVKK